MRDVFINAFSLIERSLKIYFFCTILAALLDFADFIIQLVRFGRIGDVIKLY